MKAHFPWSTIFSLSFLLNIPLFCRRKTGKNYLKPNSNRLRYSLHAWLFKVWTKVSWCVQFKEWFRHFQKFKGKKENIVGHSIIDIYIYTSDTEFMTCLWWILCVWLLINQRSSVIWKKKKKHVYWVYWIYRQFYSCFRNKNVYIFISCMNTGSRVGNPWSNIKVKERKCMVFNLILFRWEISVFLMKLPSIFSHRRSF